MVEALRGIVKRRGRQRRAHIISIAYAVDEPSHASDVPSHCVFGIVAIPSRPVLIPGTAIALIEIISPQGGAQYMLKRQISFILIVMMLVAMAAPASAQLPQLPDIPPPLVGLSVPVTGKAATGGPISGTFNILQFVEDTTAASKIGAKGTLVIRTNKGDTLVKQIVMPVTLPAGVQVASATPSTELRILPAQVSTVCTILDLTLGPLDLNLAGLLIHLDVVHLDIDADTAGGLLGSLLGGLLCSGPVSLAGILLLLNGILAALNTLIGVLSL